MIVLGLLFILVALGATAFALTAPSAAAQTIEVTALGFKVSASPLAMFLAGAASLALLGLGWALISRGTRRQARSRKELRQLRKEQAAAGAATPAEPGQHSSRRDHRPTDSNDTGGDTSAGTGGDTSAGTGADKSTGTGADKSTDTGGDSSTASGRETTTETKTDPSR